MKKTCSKQMLPLRQAENENEVIIFDEDCWQDPNTEIPSQKSIPETVNSEKDNQLICKIDESIKASKQGFFKAANVQEEKENSHEKVVDKLTEPHGILKEGYLLKKTDGFFFNTTKRYVVLTPQKLVWFQDSKKYRAIGCVNLRLLRAELKPFQGGFTLDFCGQCENINFTSKNKETINQWISILTTVLSYQRQCDKLMLQTINKPTYEYKDVLTEKQFLDAAETGDILLFYTEHIAAKLQRILTNSNFDHVAMVVKLNNKQLMIFESNQMYGVSIFGWKEYITYFNLYGKVTLRKLHYVRKAEAQASLLKFVKKNLGKKYEISAMKLLKFESDFNWEAVNEERGYFCSELIGKALKSIGLLDEKKSSGRYWPADFAENSGLHLLRGASLGPQQAIILNKHTKNKVK